MIDNAYAEHLVKRKTPSYWPAVKAGMILLFAVSLFLMLRFPFGILFPAAAGVGIYFVFLNGEIEYEYLYIDRQLTVDRIAGKSRRKRAADFDMSNAELIAPSGSDRLKEFDGKARRTMDFSSGFSGSKTYELIYSQNGSCIRVIIEPDEKMLKLMRQSVPRTFV